MGKHPSAEGAKYQITHLWDHHREMLRLLVMGYKPKEVAEMVGMTPQSVSILRNSDIAKRQIDVLRAARDASTADVSQRLGDEAAPSLEVLTLIRDNDQVSPATRAQVSQDLLSRAGFGKVQKIDANLTHRGMVTSEVIARVKQRRQAVEGQIVEAKSAEASDDESAGSGEATDER